MLRLWKTLLAADYGDDRVTLYISLDKGARQAELVRIAEDLDWPHGDKKIRVFPERQGLRPHIIACGELTREYDAVIILEDDLIVSQQYYQYAKRALAFYGDDPRIGGISLYKHLLNMDCNRPFLPEEDGSFTYLMQFAQSWGQCWNLRMWDGFYRWYTERGTAEVDPNDFPSCIMRWDEHSWMKYFMRYLRVSDQFFVYPRTSLTTCHADAGQHGGGDINDYQVPMLTGAPVYDFKPFEDMVKYDMFLERIGVPSLVEGKSMCVDLYGYKKKFDGYDLLASTARRPYRVLRTCGLIYRPQEKNLFVPVEGKDIYIYDLHTPATLPADNGLALTRYDIRTVSWKRALAYGMDGLRRAVERRLKIKRK